ncbi:DNA mismatch repair endonuclease MutL [Coraliomargarita sinensis]|uniref:DNA mismatch repair protein MutL n=1 Tax=Coraliomargarita sinensis TaxID=2174842 RepID=A0A317ZCW1_9BACT|nr:DNA mismatch repair endonuclease MutL [Coraliomargarita sinensis]PXA03045.1 DNA mismatch repair endonuclease MutL [Coraliomargarita sinensis]
MSSIRILPDRVANQIAAGEVIERPAAVVKELVENSIDSGATRIEIEFRKGGKSYIRVEDNGRGMSPDEALLALERHATSKIQDAEDLNLISSFGFRGEALPSIASVSRFTMRTRTEDFQHGTEVVINGGKLLDKKDCGMPVGTVIEVSQLFNSVPARRKFLKTDATETAHITYLCRLFAIANPGVAFRLLENRRTVFQSPACEKLEDRISEIWGRSLARDLIPVSVDGPDGKYRLTGLTAKPGVGRSTRRELVTLVNRRPVDSRTLGFAVLDAYHGRIQKGRYPPAFLFLEIQPQEVDVNVHPAKREVRFRNDGDVRRFVLGAISETLAELREPPPAPAEASDPTPAKQAPSPSAQPADQAKPRPAIRPAATTATEKVKAGSTTVADHRPKPESAPATPTRRSDWQLIRLLKNRYALFNGPKGLVLLHLRHADQRVRFERIQKTFKQNNPPSQGLLIPEPLELEPMATATLQQHLELLNKQGFNIEAFGRNFYRIEAVPTWLDPSEAVAFIRDTIDELRQRGSSRNNDELIWQTVATLAAEGSYRKNDAINEYAAQQLADELFQCDIPHTSPAGKPTFREMTWADFERHFEH